MSQTSRDRDNSRRVRTHEKNSGETVHRLGTIIQSIFCAQSGAGIGLNFWKWSGESRYPGALPSLLENFRSAVSPDPTDYPWVSEDGIGQITVPMDKGNAGSGEEKDSKCRQDPSGRPARVVKRWGGGGGSPSSVSRSHRMEIYFPFYEKQFGKRSPL